MSDTPDRLTYRPSDSEAMKRRLEQLKRRLLELQSERAKDAIIGRGRVEERAEAAERRGDAED